MATFNIKYLLSLVGGEPSIEKVAEEIYKLGFEVEEITAEELKVEITANRPDLLGAVGMARALRNFSHKSKKFTYELTGEPQLEITIDPSIKRERPFLAALVADGLTFSDESLKDLFNFSDKLCDTFGRNRKKLAVGVHDMSRVSPPLTYVLVEDESFVPLQMTKQTRYSEVLKSHEKGIRYAETIRSTDRYPVLKDREGTIALIPIINSERTKVTTKTKKILIDVTGRSEHLVEKVADLLACTMLDMGAKVSRVKVNKGDESTAYPIMAARSLQLNYKQLEKEIGVEIGYNNVISLANKMGYEAALLGKKIRFSIPQYRLDIINDQDVVEDIAIGYGYDFINPIIVPSIGAGSVEQTTVLFERLSEAMVGLGFSESMGSYLTNEEDNFGMMRLKVPAEKSYISIKDAKTSSISMLRTSLLPSILISLRASKHEKMPHRIFELDMAFRMKEKPVETYNLAAISVDPRSNFNYIKGVVESTFDALSLELSVSKGDNPSFVPGRCAIIKVGSLEIGRFGELHPEVLANFGIEEPAVALEIELSTF